jgi:hypothetical protein
MKDLSGWLRAADAAADGCAMTDDEVAAMRRAVVETARAARAEPHAWQRPVALAATAALTLAMGVLVGHQTSRPEPRVYDPPSPGASIETPRQLQFSTPGGTRIIWVFDPEFDLKETMP